MLKNKIENKLLYLRRKDFGRLSFFGRTELKLFITIFLILLFNLSHYGGDFMTDSMFALTLAIVDKGDIRIDAFVKEGCTNIPTKSRFFGCDHALFNDHWYSGFAPGASFLVLPVYLILKPFTHIIPDFVNNYPDFQIKIMLLNILAIILVIIPLASLLSVIIYKFTKFFIKNKKCRILTSLIFSFGTLFFYYSTKFDARVLATFFSFSAFYILFKNRVEQIKPWQLFIAGVFAGIAVTVEYMQAIIFVILFFYLISFLRDKRLVYYIMGAIIPLLLLFIYHDLAFGSPFNTGYSFRQGMESGVSTFNNFSFYNIWSYTLSSKYGLFFYMPVLSFFFYGLYIGLVKKRRFWREWLTISLIFLGYLLAVSSLVAESPFTFGPRYLIPVIPFLCLNLSLVIRKLGLVAISIVGGISSLINYLPVLYLLTHTGGTAGLAVLKNLLIQIPKRGLTNYTMNLIDYKIVSLSPIITNLVSITFLIFYGFFMYWLWRR